MTVVYRQGDGITEEQIGAVVILEDEESARAGAIDMSASVSLPLHGKIYFKVTCACIYTIVAATPA